MVTIEGSSAVGWTAVTNAEVTVAVTSDLGNVLVKSDPANVARSASVTNGLVRTFFQG